MLEESWAKIEEVVKVVRGIGLGWGVVWLGCLDVLRVKLEDTLEASGVEFEDVVEDVIVEDNMVKVSISELEEEFEIVRVVKVVEVARVDWLVCLGWDIVRIKLEDLLEDIMV